MSNKDDRRPEPADVSVQATTTAQEDLTTAGQRRVNLIWERTQSALALGITLANLGACLFMLVARIPVGEYPQILANAFFVVLGFYFGRTNHSAVGGIGVKASTQRYEGR